MSLSVDKPQIPDFAALTRTFLNQVDAMLQEQTKSFREDQLDEFKKRIEDQGFQSFHAEPLSPRWRAAKRKAGLPLSTMIATRTYLEAIQLVSKATAAGITSYVIQVDPTVHARDLKGEVRNDITVAEVAFINEHGSQRLENSPPARPHWAPFVVAFGESVKEKKAEIAQEVTALWNKVLLDTSK